MELSHRDVETGPASVPAPPALDRSVDVRGATVRYAVSGAGTRDLVLVHGHQANQAWWHLVAPLLEPSWRIIRLDLSGHGDSDHRDRYRSVDWVDEVLAIVEAAGAVRPVLVGHSMGGRIALAAAARRPELFHGVITLDSAVRSAASASSLTWHPERVPRVRATKEEALSRFRLAPEQPDPPGDALAVVAEASIRPVEGGWTWAYDQRGLPGMRREDVEEQMASLPLPVCFVHAGRSGIVGDDALAFLRATDVPGGLEVVALPELHHHLVLEDPELCARLVDEKAARMFG